jgi:hypothetical protein
MERYARYVKKAVHGAISNMPVGVERARNSNILLTDPSLFDGFEHLSAELRRLWKAARRHIKNQGES